MKDFVGLRVDRTWKGGGRERAVQGQGQHKQSYGGGTVKGAGGTEQQRLAPQSSHAPHRDLGRAVCHTGFYGTRVPKGIDRNLSDKGFHK